MKLLILTGIGAAILMLPDWQPPYSFIESLVHLLGYVLLFMPTFGMLMLVLNKLVNISFDTKYTNKD